MQIAVYLVNHGNIIFIKQIWSSFFKQFSLPRTFLFPDIPLVEPFKNITLAVLRTC